MAVGFGATHCGFGMGVLVAEKREAPPWPFWWQVEHLAALGAIE